MEQILIHELIRLLCKSGCEALIGNFQREINEDGNPAAWIPSETNEAIHHIKYLNEYFGKDEAVVIITSLIARYNINVQELPITKLPAQDLGLGALRQ